MINSKAARNRNRGAGVSSLACMFALLFPAGGAYAQDTASSASKEGVGQSVNDQPQNGDIVVTGFRSSITAALDEKRDAAGIVDVIKAEDIADFPDTNLAESIQRIPGVAMSRGDGGEGEVSRYVV